MSPSRRRKLASLYETSYGVLALVLTSVFLLGIATQYNLVPRIHGPFSHHGEKKPEYGESAVFPDVSSAEPNGGAGTDFPDFNKIVHVRTLSEDNVSLADPSKRLLMIGDVHGMNQSLHNLLSAVSYAPDADTLIFAGDVMAKSTHAGSLAVLDFISQHSCEGAPGRAFAVRGNHDQMVVQWRAWRDWFEPLELGTLQAVHDALVPADDENDSPDTGARPRPPVSTGRGFLKLVEGEWKHDRKRDPKGAADPDAWADTARKRAAGSWREQWWARVPHPGKGHAKKDWGIFDDHYWIAKDMTEAQKECLYSLPLVLHIPSEHFFVAHAGILPSDPKRPLTDKRQPLAHPPDLHSHAEPDDGEVIAPLSGSSVAQQTLRVLAQGADAQALPYRNETLGRLRTAQERAILTDVPDNWDPWVLLNMRGVRKSGKVTRNNNKGTPWSEVWNDQIARCAGFDDALLAGGPDNVSGGSVEKRARDGHDEDSEKVSLPCEPATVVYGHAATRSLDVKRWSVGIDTGCLYGRKLTALVLQRPDGAADVPEVPDDEEDEEDEDEDEDEDDEYDGEEGEEDQDEDDEEFAPSSRFTRIAERVRSCRRTKAPRKPPRIRRIQFGDDDAGIKAHLVSVKCPKAADLS